MRGKRLTSQSVTSFRGSIPARAGETTRPARRLRRDRVHPRACGGNAVEGGAGAAGTGPSPRVRGKHRVGRHQRHPERSIPARAGETTKTDSNRKTSRVHPRACGGNSPMFSGVSPDRGPSPRVRGKPGQGAVRPARRGSIPARAGETLLISSDNATEEVHPRACGGN